MSITAEKTIREIAVENPATIRVFERFGIDYCCGGRKPLQQACAELRLSYDQVVEKIEETVNTVEEGASPTWDDVTLSKIIQIIVRKHHVFTRQELPRLKALAAKVESRHGQDHPELAAIRQRVERLEQEMFEHMEKEEHVLFTAIARTEHCLRSAADLPANPFGKLDNPIRKMMAEHDVAGGLCAEIKRLSSDYQPPENACPSYRGLYAGLQDFERDLHQHVHLENNILFPRAIALETNAGTAADTA
jgi:regulator of cell morphogenesis and NO signaling